MMRDNRILSTFVFLGLLALAPAARSQNTIPTKGAPKTFTISGTIGLAGVTLTGFPPGNVRTDENGVYSVVVPEGWSGVVKPAKEGHEFRPQQRTYDRIVGDSTSQDYTGSVVMFTISGSVGLPGVAMKGLPQEVYTDENGRYAAKVLYGWAGAVTPVKVGYQFTPPFRQYPPLRKDWVGENYGPGVIRFTISGNVGMPGVTIQGVPQQCVTNPQGGYEAQVEYGWSGMVTPTKLGCRFEPPARQYTQVVQNHEKESYTGRPLTFTISGNVGLPGVVMRGFPGDVVSDEGGRYSVELMYGWAGAVRPDKPGYEFQPASRSYGKVTKGYSQEDYVPIALTYVISGNAGAPGVMMRGLPRGPVTDPQGNYRVQVEHGWSGVVSPHKEGFEFTPPERTYDRIAANLSNENYAARERMLTISNTIKFGNEPISDVRVTAEPGGYAAMSDSQGRYDLRVPYGWSGSLVFSKPGHDFADQVEYQNVTTDIDETAASPSGHGRMVRISNVVTFNGEPVSDLVIRAQPGGYSAVTGPDGRYSIQVPYGWSGQLVPQAASTKVGGRIPPASYVDVTSDVIDGNRLRPPRTQVPASSRAFPQVGAPKAVDDVLVIPTVELTPETVAETTEDLRVMLHIFRDKLSEPRMILGVLRDYGGFFDSDRKVEAIYLQGTAAVFVIEVDFPYSFPTQRPDEGQTQAEAVDPIWQRARQKLYSPAGSRVYGQPGQTQEMTFEQFKEELLRSLRHAANVRHIDPNELVILTIVAQNEEAGWPSGAVSRGAHSGAGGAYGEGPYAGSRSGRSASRRSGMPVLDRQGNPRLDALGRPVAQGAAPSASTVLTMQAKKADINAFARGELDFEQFQQRVKTFAY